MRYQCQFCQFINTLPPDAVPGQHLACQSCKRTLVVPDGIAPGTVIDDFVIVSHIGTGSIGSVYKAIQISLGRTVALKVLHSEFRDKKGLNDFLREARSAAQLNYLNLVQSYAIGEADGYVFMAMTLINGMTLKERLQRDKVIQTDEALHIIQQVAEGLHYAWTEAQIVHRDIKPENIILTENGVVKITDLGLAIRPDEWKAGMEISGSPAYMSPEQFYGEKLDTRSDIYSMGIMLYQMLAGVLPYRSDDVNEVAKMHIQTEAVPLSKVNRLIPVAVSGLVRKMMAKYPEDRFRNMEELLEQIWRIRQKTAPNSDLVPSVHTISIRRLDYERQIESRRDAPESAPASPYSTLNPYIPIGSIKKTWQTHPFFAIAQVLLLVLLLATIVFLWFENQILIQGNEPSEDEQFIRRKVAVFEQKLTEFDIPQSYVKDQSEILLHEIDMLHEPTNLREIVKLLVSQYELSNRAKKLQDVQDANVRLESELRSMETRNEFLNRQLTNVNELHQLTDSQYLEYVATRSGYAKLQHKYAQLLADHDSMKVDMKTLSNNYRCDLRASYLLYFYMNLRYGPPGINYDFLSSNPAHQEFFSAKEVALFDKIVRRHYDLSELLRKPSTFSGAKLTLNGIYYKVVGSSGNVWILSDPQRQTERILPEKIPLNEMLSVIDQISGYKDTDFTHFTYCFSQGYLGAALSYVPETSDPAQCIYTILNLFYDRLSHLARRHPQYIPILETVIKRLAGNSEKTESYIQKFDSYVQMYKSMKPEKPLELPASDTVLPVPSDLPKSNLIQPKPKEPTYD